LHDQFTISPGDHDLEHRLPRPFIGRDLLTNQPKRDFILDDSRDPRAVDMVNGASDVADRTTQSINPGDHGRSTVNATPAVQDNPRQPNAGRDRLDALDL